MNYKCEKCLDTGSIKGELYLDCTSCEVAKERAALHAYLAKNQFMHPYELAWLVHQRALSLAAAPQVVADERATALWNSLHEVMEWYAVHGSLHHTTIMCNARAALAAPKVQAQEPVEIAGLGRMTDEDDGYVTLQFKNEELAQDFMSGYSPSVDVRDMPPVAPVQPVAVPDGALREVVGKIITAMESSAAPVKLAFALNEVANQGGRIDFAPNLMAELAMVYEAAPAAQGDAKWKKRFDFISSFRGGDIKFCEESNGKVALYDFNAPGNAMWLSGVGVYFDTPAEAVDAAIAAKAAS